MLRLTSVKASISASLLVVSLQRRTVHIIHPNLKTSLFHFRMGYKRTHTDGSDEESYAKIVILWKGDLSEVCIWEIFWPSRWVEVMGIMRDPGCDPRLFLFNWQILEFLLFCKLVNLKYFRLLVYRYHVLGANLRSSVCLRWIKDVYRLSLYAQALRLFLQNHSANWFFFLRWTL